MWSSAPTGALYDNDAGIRGTGRPGVRPVRGALDGTYREVGGPPTSSRNRRWFALQVFGLTRQVRSSFPHRATARWGPRCGPYGVLGGFAGIRYTGRPGVRPVRKGSRRAWEKDRLPRQSPCGRSPGVLHIGAAAPVWSFLKGGVQRGEKAKAPLWFLFLFCCLFSFWKSKRRKANHRPPIRRTTLFPPPGQGVKSPASRQRSCQRWLRRHPASARPCRRPWRSRACRRPCRRRRHRRRG